MVAFQFLKFPTSLIFNGLIILLILFQIIIDDFFLLGNIEYDIDIWYKMQKLKYFYYQKKKKKKS
jgi:hypothetical protein